jgi:hypothetical protein
MLVDYKANTQSGALSEPQGGRQFLGNALLLLRLGWRLSILTLFRPKRFMPGKADSKNATGKWWNGGLPSSVGMHVGCDAADPCSMHDRLGLPMPVGLVTGRFAGTDVERETAA